MPAQSGDWHGQDMRNSFAGTAQSAQLIVTTQLTQLE